MVNKSLSFTFGFEKWWYSIRCGCKIQRVRKAFLAVIGTDFIKIERGGTGINIDNTLSAISTL